eukprot:486387-Ditylum_brightwellii.AAC.1
MDNIVNRFWRFFQARDMSNIVYYKMFKNLLEVAEEHGASLGIHPGLLIQEAYDPDAPMDDKIDVTKGSFWEYDCDKSL